MPHLCDGGGSVVVRGGAVGVGPGPLLLLVTGVLVTGAEHRSSVPVQDRQPGNVGCSRLSEDTAVKYYYNFILPTCPAAALSPPELPTQTTCVHTLIAAH